MLPCVTITKNEEEKKWIKCLKQFSPSYWLFKVFFFKVSTTKKEQIRTDNKVNSCHSMNDCGSYERVEEPRKLMKVEAPKSDIRFSDTWKTRIGKTRKGPKIKEEILR